MKKTLAFLLSALCLLFCACEGSVYEIDLSQALSDNGEFTYPGLSWGVSSDEVTALLGIDLVGQAASSAAQSAAKDSQPVLDVIGPKDDSLRVKINGNYGMIYFQFTDNRLNSVTITFRNNLPGMERNNLEKLVEKTNFQLREQFGEPSVEIVDKRLETSAALVSSCRWDGTEEPNPRVRDSQLALGYVKDADGKIISVSVMASKPAAGS